jgi:[protein-PII] uridylyltransferase
VTAARDAGPAEPADTGDPAALRASRQALIDDRALTGIAWCQAYARAADDWLQRVFARATRGDDKGVALLAVGGYGRAEIAPRSDLDLLLVHDRRARVKPVADAIWYPIWDAGISLDHSVRTPKEVRSTMDADIKVALGLLNGRRVAGDPDLAHAVLTRALDQWGTRAGRWLPALDEVTRHRHHRFGDLAFLLEPDLKEARGGQRDLHLLWSLAGVVPVLAGVLGDPALVDAAGALAAARVELQRLTGRSVNALLLQDQDAVAAALGYPDADGLMAGLATAGRTVAWVNDDGWRRLESWLSGPARRGGGRDSPLEPGLVLRDGEVTLIAEAPVDVDTSLALRTAAISAELDKPIARTTLDRLGAAARAPEDIWPPETHHALLRLLGAGPPAVAAIESLDQVGVWVRYLPEWAAVRNKPQRNPYHRFTVDRHLVETAAGAARLTRSVSRPDLLLLGALLHDIGKGRGGDHTDIGVALVDAIGPRLGLGPGDVSTLQNLVRHHLLLPEVATRRDLDDPATAAAVAAAIGDQETLLLLAALTEADALATGPSAWGAWKAGLVDRLVTLTSAALAGQPPPAPGPVRIGPDQRALLEAGGLHLWADGGRLTVAAPDRPGLLATVAGVLSLARVTVRSATTLSDAATGMALLRFAVAPAFDDFPDWNHVRDQLAAALAGRLALGPRLEERERHSARHRWGASAVPTDVVVTIDTTASVTSTVVEVRAPDRGPVLYQLARALTGCGVTITRALINTLGPEVLDVFYVQTVDGTPVDDPTSQQQLVGAVTRALLADGPA